MTLRFNKALKTSLVMHAAVLILLLVVPLLGQCARKKPKENVIFIEMVSPAPPAPAPRIPEPEPPKPPPPTPEPPKPEPKPEPLPEPEPKPVVKKPEIKVNTNRIVRRPDTPPPPPPPPRVTERELREQLLSSLPTSPTATTSASSPSELASYYGNIQRILYQAWDQPPGVSGLKTRVSIRIARTGAIMQRDLLGRSGSQVMDDSVMRALRSVSTFPRLPASVTDAFIDITITFESTGLSM